MWGPNMGPMVDIFVGIYHYIHQTWRYPSNNMTGWCFVLNIRQYTSQFDVVLGSPLTISERGLIHHDFFRQKPWCFHILPNWSEKIGCSPHGFSDKNPEVGTTFSWRVPWRISKWPSRGAAMQPGAGGASSRTIGAFQLAMGVPKNRWVLSWKIPLKMDDGSRGSPILGNLQLKMVF